MANNLAAAWADGRGSNGQIYAGALTSAGANTWTLNGAQVGAATQAGNAALWLDACPDGSGGMYIAFMEVRSVAGVTPYLMRIDSGGSAAAGWPVGGRSLSNQSMGIGVTGSIRVVQDGSGGAIVAWSDSRGGSNIFTPYAQRVNGGGVAQWSANGVNLRTSGTSGVMDWISMAGDGSGGAYVAYVAINSCRVQYVSPTGVIQFGAAGAGSFTGGGLSYGIRGAHVVNSGDGCFLLVNSTASRVRRLTTTGTTYPGWSASGTAIGIVGLSGADGGLVSDGAGGVIAFYYQQATNLHNVMAQRVNGSGVNQWLPAQGVTVGPSITAALGTLQMSNYSVIRDNAGTGAVITWRHGPALSATCDIYCARVNTSGTVVFATNVCSASDLQETPVVVSDDNAGYFVAWADKRGGINPDIYAQRVDETGAISWAANGVALASSTGHQTLPAIVSTTVPVPASPPALPDSRTSIELNIRYLIDDLDKDHYAISSARMVQLMNGALHHIANRALLPAEAIQTVTLVAGTYDYSLSDTLGDLRSAVLDAFDLPLERMEFDEMVSVYRQDSALPAPRGIPRYYSVRETSGQVATLRVAPTPDTLAAGPLKVWRSTIPASLASETSTVPLTDVLLRALERLVAAECVAVMHPEDRLRRMLGVEQVREWSDMADRAIREENWRLRVATGSTQNRIMEATDQWL